MWKPRSPRGGDLLPVDRLDVGESRPLAQAHLQGLQALGRSLGHDLDAAVGEVLREAGQPALLGLAQHEVPIADALHPAPARETGMPPRPPSRGPEPITRSGRARPRPPRPSDQAHWKLKPPRRPSTSRISPTRKSPRQRRDSMRRRVDLGEGNASGRDLGDVVAAALAHGQRSSPGRRPAVAGARHASIDRAACRRPRPPGPEGLGQ